MLKNLKHSGVPKKARRKLRAALRDIDARYPPQESLSDWRLTAPASEAAFAADETAVSARHPVVTDPQARDLLRELTPKPVVVSSLAQQAEAFAKAQAAAAAEDPLCGADTRSVFALRRSQRYRVGTVAFVRWQRGWYAVRITQVNPNAPTARISYLPPFRRMLTSGSTGGRSISMTKQRACSYHQAQQHVASAPLAWRILSGSRRKLSCGR